MKRKFVLILMGLLALTLVSCQQNDNPKTEVPTEKTPD